MPPGLSHAGMLLVASAEPVGVALATAAPAAVFWPVVFSATRVAATGASGAGAGGAADGVTTGACGVPPIGAWATWFTAARGVGALVLGAAAAAAAATATGPPGAAAFCSATTPNAARAKVTNAAMTKTTTLIAPSTRRPTPGPGK